MQLACYGRLGGTPKEIQTSTGTVMAIASMAVVLADRHGEEHKQWLGVVAFGRTAEALLKHDTGDMVSVAGAGAVQRLHDERGRGPREQLQVVADSLVSARTVRPPGGRSRARTPATEEA
jgi:single-strand DNA-binding protein